MKPGVKKYKVSRRLGVPIFEKCQTQKFALREQRKVVKKSFFSKGSEYKQQLIEKQKLRYMFNLSESALKKYIKASLKGKKGTHEESLTALLETRLDNIVYRFGLVGTRLMAKQVVSHGHITVNGKKTTIPSYKVGTKDVIGIREGSLKTALFSNLSKKKMNIPKWLSWEQKTNTGKIVGDPESDESIVNLSTVFEYYSR